MSVTSDGIIINNVVIQHGAWSIQHTQQADDASAAFLTSAALFIANATSIVVSNVEISHTGSYGIRIKEGTSGVNVINSKFADMGAGGIWIGDQTSAILVSPRSSGADRVLSELNRFFVYFCS